MTINYELIHIAPNLPISGGYRLIDIQLIRNVFDKDLHCIPQESKEVSFESTLILQQLKEDYLECLGGVVTWKQRIQHYQPSHINCFVFDPTHHSAMETQEIKSICKYFIPALHNSDEAEILIEKYYTDQSFQQIIEKHFKRPGKRFTLDSFFELLPAWGRTVETLQKRKEKFGAVLARPRNIDKSNDSSDQQQQDACIATANHTSDHDTNVHETITNTSPSDSSLSQERHSTIEPLPPTSKVSYPESHGALNLDKSGNENEIRNERAPSPSKVNTTRLESVGRPVEPQQLSNSKNYGTKVEMPERSDDDINKSSPDTLSIEGKWNSFARENNAPSYINVEIILEKPERIQEFNDVINSGNLDLALRRLNKTMSNAKPNPNA
jgi:hypothetical protein